jgi:hypothetical protein
MWSATCQRPMLLVSFLVALNMGQRNPELEYQKKAKVQI